MPEEEYTLPHPALAQFDDEWRWYDRVVLYAILLCVGLIALQGSASFPTSMYVKANQLTPNPCEGATGIMADQCPQFFNVSLVPTK